MAVTALHTFGWSKELDLKPRIEGAVEEEITKTATRYDSADFISNTYVIELKSRRKYDRKGNLVTSKTYDTWLLPVCKGDIQTDGKDLLFLYYFEGDDTLWYALYDKELFDTFYQERPSFHPTGQLHWYVPSSAFTLLD